MAIIHIYDYRAVSVLPQQQTWTNHTQNWLRVNIHIVAAGLQARHSEEEQFDVLLLNTSHHDFVISIDLAYVVHRLIRFLLAHVIRIYRHRLHARVQG